MAVRRSPTALPAKSVLFAAAFGCAKVLGFDHGVPAPAPCEGCATSGAGGIAPSRAGSGGARSGGSGAMGPSGGARPRPAGAGGSDSSAGPEDGGMGPARPLGSAGQNEGGSAGTRSGETTSGESGSGGTTECLPDDCISPDPEHCIADCTFTADALRCDVSPRDADGDRHGDARCVVAGDDCDDTSAAVNPEAIERCDGVDNDCNGRRDVEEGLPLSGEDRSLPSEHGTSLVPAYLAESGRFLLAWKPDPPTATAGIAYAVVDRNAMAVGQGFIPSEDGEPADFALASGTSEFGIFWSNDVGAHFQRISPEAELGSSVTVTSSDYVPHVALAFAANGGWTAFWQQDLEVWARRVGAADSLGPVVKMGQIVDNAPMQATASGDAILFVWQLAGSNNAVLIPHSLVGGTDLALGYDAKGRPIYGSTFSARPEGFGIVGTSGAGLLFEILDRAGMRRCGPVPLAAAPFFFDVAPSANGFVVLSDATLDEFDLDCRLLQHATSPSVALPGRPRLAAAGGDGYLLTWQSLDTTPPKLGFRRIGAHFCD
jgi:hypothetical protein